MAKPNFKKAKEEAYKTLMLQENFSFPINPKNIKLKEYEKANLLLKKAKNDNVNPNTIDKILWFLSFTNLKLNNLEQLKETLDEINTRKNTFKAHSE